MRVLVSAVLLLLATPTLASPASSVVNLIGEAHELFRQATMSAGRSPAEARRLYTQSAACFEKAIDAGAQNRWNFVNLANTYLLIDDVGRAVLNYRRAAYLAPTDPRVQAGLAEARARVGIEITPSRGRTVRDAIMAWRNVVPRWVLLGVFGAAWSLGWIAWLVRSSVIRSLGWSVPVSSWGVAVVALSPLMIEAALTERIPVGVIVGADVVAYNGPSEAVYAESFDGPLPGGVEVDVIETRDGWTRIRLASGRETWVPSDAIECVGSCG